MLLSSDTLASRPPRKSDPPGGLNATPHTWSAWLLIVCTAALILRSQSLTVLSLEPVATAAPSGLTSKLNTQLACPDIAPIRVLPSASYMWTWASSEAVKSNRGSTGEKTSERTGIWWPSKWCKNLARLTSKTLIVPSIDPQARRLPSGLHATDKTNFLLELLSVGFELSGRGIDRVATSSHEDVSQSFTDALLPPATARMVPWMEKLLLEFNNYRMNGVKL